MSPEKAITYIRGYFQKPGGFIALDALNICLKYHTGLRKDGVTPEWYHPVSVMLWLMCHEDTLDTISGITYCVALLHDTAEDHGVMLEAFEKKFPRDLEIAYSVRLLSKHTIDRAKKSNDDYYQDLSSDDLASLVKGADRIDNLRTMTNVFTHEHQRYYIKDTRENVLPMIKRARHNFPKRRAIYEAIKYDLVLACDLIEEKLDVEQRLHTATNKT
jgi:(p)ppGpp synthase/HD superfamily hydrolase